MSDLFHMHVLVVDDEPSNVRLLERVLQKAGYRRVSTTTDPRAAVEQLDRAPPDLVLLDLHMPHIDGFELLAYVRSRSGHSDYLPVLVLTADVTDDAKRRALAAGGTDFLTKPFDDTEVLLRVHNLLETKSLYVRLQAHNADLARQLREHEEAERRAAEAREQSFQMIRRLLDSERFHPVFQPIVELSSGRVVGVEALTRFTMEPQRPPDAWFGDAADVGLGPELEVAAVRAALTHRSDLPEDTYLSVNLAPATLMQLDLTTLFKEASAYRVTVEVTEHAAIDDYDDLLRALDRLRERGVRLAIDDAGAGFASLRHILRLKPDVIKLDIGITHDVDTDPVRRALASALVAFARDTGATLVAEGIESSGEMDTLKSLGVPCGQGYYLGRPGRAVDVPEVVEVSSPQALDPPNDPGLR